MKVYVLMIDEYNKPICITKNPETLRENIKWMCYTGRLGLDCSIEEFENILDMVSPWDIPFFTKNCRVYKMEVSK